MKYVALLDILGFKSLVDNNSHEDLIKHFDQFRVFLQMSLTNHKTTTDKWGNHTFDMSKANINSNIISDSLIFWTENEEATSLFEMIDCLYSLTQFCHNLPKIYLRGGLTCGDFDFQSNTIKNKTQSIHPIMVGKGLVEVYEIEKKLEIAGCVITNAAINQAKQNGGEPFEQMWHEYTSKNKLLRYSMPTKKEDLECWTINWVRATPTPTAEEIENGFSSFNKKTDHEDVQRKIKNTLKYFHYVQDEILKVGKH